MQPLKNSYRLFSQKALQFLYLMVLQPIFTGAVLFTFAGVVFFLLILVNAFGYLNPSNGVYVVGAFVGVMLAISFYFYSAFKGALVKGFSQIAFAHGMDLEDFLVYSMVRGMKFFGISILKIFLYIIILAPLAIAYYFRPDFFSAEYIPIVLAAVYIPLFFIIEYGFCLSYIGVALRDFGVRDAIKASLKMTFKSIADFFPLYLVYAIVWWARLIPLVGIAIHFVLYPVVYTALIFQFQESVGRSYRPSYREEKDIDIIIG
ncbi:MAG: hypothetical protein QXY05_03675 [Candidatus Anstonellales archaeon]